MPKSPFDPRCARGILHHGATTPVVAFAVGCLVVGVQGASPRPVVDLLEAYDSGAYAVVESELAARKQNENVAKFAREIKDIAPAWIKTGGSLDVPRRRLVVATLALEAARGLPLRENPRLARSTELEWPDRRSLLEWACKLTRETQSPIDAERWWHLAAIALLEQGLRYPFYAWEDQPAQVQSHVDHARGRFPDEPRFLLARAVAEKWFWLGPLIKMPSDHRPDVRVIESPSAEGPIGIDLVLVDPSRNFPSDPRDSRVHLRRFFHGLAALQRDESPP